MPPAVVRGPAVARKKTLKSFRFTEEAGQILVELEQLLAKESSQRIQPLGVRAVLGQLNT